MNVIDNQTPHPFVLGLSTSLVDSVLSTAIVGFIRREQLTESLSKIGNKPTLLNSVRTLYQGSSFFVPPYALGVGASYMTTEHFKEAKPEIKIIGSFLAAGVIGAGIARPSEACHMLQHTTEGAANWVKRNGISALYRGAIPIAARDGIGTTVLNLTGKLLDANDNYYYPKVGLIGGATGTMTYYFDWLGSKTLLKSKMNFSLKEQSRPLLGRTALYATSTLGFIVYEHAVNEIYKTLQK